ncbi:Magnesium transporter MRS2-4 [Micractinium conductrix]|uniref:Magnesium transporter MRS2-4 n=1 Tax=Micractinium conductrix TaxID=554055 RepID=A0A2P6V5N3_9CHLO|nr:Magnesium transporter MRS2-4 [Micractinium conductrix]|eukprot:PSC69394.1 Magnesium transporter MRS2-4 [Micractinium conductrix]
MSRRPAAAFVARFRAAGRQQTANGVLSSSPSPQAGAAVVTAAAPAAAVYASWQPRPRRSFCSSSSRCLALGIVEQLRDSSAPAAVEAAAAARSQRWEVVQFSADGGAEETETSPEALGLHPRDVYLFDADAEVGAQGAVLAPRARAFLFRTDACRAVVFSDRAVLWPGQRKAETVKVAQASGQPCAPLLKQAIKDFVSVQSALPFELRALEALLSETVRGYATNARRLAVVAETVLADLGAGEQTSTGELQRLIPIERQLTHMQMMLREALGGIEQMRASWHMALDHQRNRVLRVDLFVGVVSLCAA